MINCRILIACLATSFSSTGVILVVSLLNLLFSHRQVGYYSSYFGFLIFEISDKNLQWDLYMSFGLNFERLYVFFLTMLIIAMFYYMLTMIYLTLNKSKGNQM
ncbi:hypothetical protein AEQ18_12320 [Enterococcus sp. RIT-PI-f]|nr:hypothetical protein AEQ18_12320 [Enterococcus sp. RIT-PI-f]